MSENRDRDRDGQRRRAGRAAEKAALAAVERLLAAAAEPVRHESERARGRQEAAVVAFRAARGTPTGPRRSQDDWRPRRGLGAVFACRAGGVSRSKKAVIGAVVAAAALGGVAVAAGTGAVPNPFGTGDSGSRPAPVHSASAEPSGGPGTLDRTRPGRTDPTPPAGRGDAGPRVAPPGRGTPKQWTTVSLCRAYQAAAGSGAALDSEAFGRLADTAGGERAVDGYCDRLMKRQGKRWERSEGSSGGRTQDEPPASTRPSGSGAEQRSRSGRSG
ncbi:hypothetical protein [Streptomyces sp. KR80]|uniref:hypothetical protein n=1 Tax=Streptomyces sp. KR80 TaxID=3457426 RepID=UPI003FD5DA5C